MTVLRATLLLLALLLLDCRATAHKPVPETEKYEVVYPQKLHAQHRRDTESQYPDRVHYGLEVNGRSMVLQLEKTEDLLSNYSETHYLDDGTPVTTIPVEQQDHCYYQGRVKNDNRSQVSLSACKGLSGIIITQEQKLLIEPLNMTESGAHAVYEYQEQEIPKTCGVNSSMYNESIETKVSFSTSNAEKEAFLKARKYIQLYIVADRSMYLKYNRNKKELQERIFLIMNFVNLVYKPLNLFVALTGLEIWDTQDQFKVVTSANTNLDLFSKWRQTNLLPRKPNDNAQFLTNIDFDGSTVGLAWLRTMCSDTSSTGVVQDHSTDYVHMAATVAHEMGHNLGMDHDTYSCYCTDQPCIMVDTLSSKTPKHFSACSHQNYQDFLLKSMPLCMKNRPRKNEIMTTPVCGNKFTEQGEECDCGTEEECTNKCCDAKTCKMKEGFQCAEGGCCSKCQLRKAGWVCRPAKDDCDLADMCDGKSSTCPTDRFRVNGFSCHNGEGYCYNGKCPTLRGQCEMYWGTESYVAADSCFTLNSRSSPGFCRQSGVNVYCRPQDVKCGVLFCSGGNAMPIIPKYGYHRQSSCKSLNPQELVEERTKCGNQSICQDGRCTSIALALQQSANCSAKCPGHGVCNDELECQCEEGWAPPNCDYYEQELGAGYIVLIVIIVLVLIIVIALLAWRFQRRKQRKTGPGSGVTNPTFNIQNKTNQRQAYPSTPQMYPVNAMYPPQPPVQSQKPQAFNVYSPQPPIQSQKPFTPHGFQRPTAGPPPRPAYPSVPSQAINPNYRR